MSTSSINPPPVRIGGSNAFAPKLPLRSRDDDENELTVAVVAVGGAEVEVVGVVGVPSPARGTRPQNLWKEGKE